MVQISRDHFGGGVFIFKNDNTIRMQRLHRSEHRILAIDRHSMIERIDTRAQREFDDFEIHDHIVAIKGVAREHHFDAPRVAMRKSARLCVLAEHVPRFDSK